MGGAHVLFENVMKHLNGMDNAQNPLSIKSETEKTKKKELTYEDFKDQYAAAFTKVHEDMERMKKKKNRLKKIKKRKWKQQLNGGKMCDILGVSEKSKESENIRMSIVANNTKNIYKFYRPSTTKKTKKR